MPRWVNYWVTARSGWTTIQHTHLKWCCVCIPVTDLCTGYAQLPEASSGRGFLLHSYTPLTSSFFPVFHSVKLQLDVFIYFMPFTFNTAIGAGLPSAVRALPEFWKSPATLHPPVPSWAGVGIPPHHGQQRSSEQWVHRGPSLGHLQSGVCLPFFGVTNLNSYSLKQTAGGCRYKLFTWKKTKS